MEKRAFLTLLNSEDPTPEHWADLGFEGVPGLPDHGFIEDRKRWKRDDLHRGERLSQATRILKELVSGWIDSGFRSDGEDPARRHYQSLEDRCAFAIVASLLNCSVGAKDSGVPNPSFMTANLIGTDDDPRYTRPMQPEGPNANSFVLTANHAGPGQTNVPIRGALAIQLSPRGGIEFVPAFFGHRLTPLELAAWVFLHFWTSGWIFSLMRCNTCRRFFFPMKVWSGHTYPRGWQCSLHSKSASAANGAKKKRRNFREKWLSHAVIGYVKFHNRKHRISNEIVFITGHVQDALRKDGETQTIKRHSIARNMSTIRSLAEKEMHPARVPHSA